MRDRKALKAITNAIMKAHVDVRQQVMDKAKAQQFARAALTQGGLCRYEAGLYGCVRSGTAASDHLTNSLQALRPLF